MMKAFILAAGKGTRLLPLTSRLPKPLIPVLGIPLLCYTLARIKTAGIDRVIINIHYRGERIVEFLAHHKNFGIEIELSEEGELLGTGGGIKKCSHQLVSPFMLLNADIICDLDLREFINHWQESGKTSMLAISEQGEPSVAVQNGSVIDFNGLVRSGIENNYSYFGQAIIKPEIFKCMPAGYSSLVTGGLIPLVETGRLDSYVHSGWWFDLGTPAGISKAEIFLETKKSINNLLASGEILLDQDYLNWFYQGVTEV
jgi:mannose-1-phosphate guanylyltransferase